jgi:hypothetical protein
MLNAPLPISISTYLVKELTLERSSRAKSTYFSILLRRDQNYDEQKAISVILTSLTLRS